MGNLNDRRQAIRDKILDYLLNGDPAVPLVVSVYPGGGKTTNALAVLFGSMEVIDGEVRNMVDVGMGPGQWKFVYLAPRHVVIRDSVDKIYHGQFTHLESRLRLCNSPEVKTVMGENDVSYFPIEYFCQACQYRHVLRRDIVLEGDAEPDGGIASTCPYDIRRREVEADDMPPWAGVHQHAITYLEDYLGGEITIDGKKAIRRSRIDAIIMEENPMKALLETRAIRIDDVSDIRREARWFDAMCKGDQHFKEATCGVDDYSAHVGVYLEVLEFLIWALDDMRNKPTKRTPRKGATDDSPPDTISRGMTPSAMEPRWEKLQAVIDEWRTLEWEDFDHAWAKFLGKRMFEDLGVERLRYVSEQLGTLHRLLDKVFKVSVQEKLPFHFSIVDEDWKYPRDVYINVNYFHNNVLPSLGCKVIALDGTGDADTWDHILGTKCEFFPEKGLYDKVTRVTWHNKGNPAFYYKSTYLHDGNLTGTGKEIMELVPLIVREHAREKGDYIAVIGPKALRAHVYDECDIAGIPREKVRYEHYYNLTSDNTMQGASAIVALSTPQPPERQLEASVQLSGWSRDVWVKHYVDNEMVQAIARARPTLDTKPYGIGLMSVSRPRPAIYVFGSQDIFSGSRKEEVVWENYREMTRHMLEGKLKYGGDGTIMWTKKELRAATLILACCSTAPITKAEIQKTTGFAWGLVKRVTSHLLMCGLLAAQGNKIVKVKEPWT